MNQVRSNISYIPSDTSECAPFQNLNSHPNFVMGVFSNNMQRDFLQQKETTRTLEHTIGVNGRLVRCASPPPVERAEQRSSARARWGVFGDAIAVPPLQQDFVEQQGPRGGLDGGGEGKTERVLGEASEWGGGRGGGGVRRQGDVQHQERGAQDGETGVRHKREERQRQRQLQRQDGSLHAASVRDWEFSKGVAVYVVEVETLGQKDARNVYRRQESRFGAWVGR